MSDWSRALLGEIADIIDPHPSHRAPDEVEQGIPFIGIGDVREDGTFIEGKGRLVSTQVFVEHARRYDLTSNTIGFGRVATIGKVIDFQDTSEKVVISPTMALIEPYVKEDRDFILFALQGQDIKDQIDRLLTGSTRSSLGIELLRKLEVLLPPHPVRRKMSTIFETVSRQITQTQSLIDKYTAIKQGMMADLFSRGIDTTTGQLRPSYEDAPELYKETELGWVPREWEVLPVGEAFDIQLGKMLSKKSKTGRFSAPYLGNKNVQWNKVDCRDLESMDFYPSERSKFSLLRGDLLICEGGDVGRAAIWNDEISECYYQKAIHRLRPIRDRAHTKLVLRYMWYIKNCGVINNYVSQTSIAHLTREKLAQILLIAPTNEEQFLMIQRFDQIDIVEEIESARLKKLMQQKKGLMQALLTGKVPVPV